jgi:hypothetical protein
LAADLEYWHRVDGDLRRLPDAIGARVCYIEAGPHRRNDAGARMPKLLVTVKTAVASEAGRDFEGSGGAC